MNNNINIFSNEILCKILYEFKGYYHPTAKIISNFIKNKKILVLKSIKYSNMNHLYIIDSNKGFALRIYYFRLDKSKYQFN